ncbi:hypothetical protein CR513_20695, partial [Mucuna pruriens]
MAVSKQVFMVVTLGKYSDEILCDVVPTEATYILLGRSLQFHRQKIHDGVTNRFSFVHKGQKVTIKILSPRKGERMKRTKRKRESKKDPKKRKKKKIGAEHLKEKNGTESPKEKRAQQVSDVVNAFGSENPAQEVYGFHCPNALIPHQGSWVLVPTNNIDYVDGITFNVIGGSSIYIFDPGGSGASLLMGNSNTNWGRHEEYGKGAKHTEAQGERFASLATLTLGHCLKFIGRIY